MVDVYSESAVKFTPDVQPHYIYSPRELSRWVRAMHEAIKAGASAVAAGALFQFTDATPRGAAEYLYMQGVEVRL